MLSLELGEVFLNSSSIAGGDDDVPLIVGVFFYNFTAIREFPPQGWGPLSNLAYGRNTLISALAITSLLYECKMDNQHMNNICTYGGTVLC